MVLGRAEAAREAAVEAVTALCSFHQEGKLAYLEGLVQALTQRQEVQVRPDWLRAAQHSTAQHSTAQQWPGVPLYLETYIG
jgi:hypothetical protein